MRLLHSTTLELKEVVGGEIPPYAILSHTWREKEVSFQDLQSSTGDEEVYDKIKRFCGVATADGFDFVWMDICCIDKTSSSELSEAINSMYRWYRDAEVCYVYLSDVSYANAHSDFASSRWFTRGWTLQELIAPSTVIFLTSDWQEIGTKSSYQAVISKITGIPANILLGDNPDTASIAQRMSWASKRETTRVEDIAYCLMGIFGINMSMLYGEGERAFIRLQEEIMKVSDDHTIFAWMSRTWDNNIAGFLATSPAAFAASGNFIRSSHEISRAPFTVTNKGLHLQLPLIAFNSPKQYLAVLNCQEIGKVGKLLGIWLRSFRTGDYIARDRCDEIATFGLKDVTGVEMKSVYVINQLPAPHRDATSYRKCFIKRQGIEDHGFSLCEIYPSHHWTRSDGKITCPILGDGRLGLLKFADGHTHSFAVILKKKGTRLSANVITDTGSETGEEIFLSFPKESISSQAQTPIHQPRPFVKRQWQNEADRIFKPYLSGQICIAIRKQIISGQRHFVVNISLRGVRT